jgi:HEAT repeat protein
MLRTWVVIGLFALLLGCNGKDDRSARIQELVKQLEDPNPVKRHEAVWELGDIGSGGVVPHLIRALEDPESKVRATAARKLGEIGDARAVGPLNSSARSSDSSVRHESLIALERITGEDIIKQVSQEKKSPD